MMRLAAVALLFASLAFGQFGGSNARRVQGRPVASTAPSDTNVICWDASAATWKPCTAGGSSIAFSGVAAGTNAAALVIGTGGSLGVSGSGTIAATTAVALAANGTNCSAGSYPLGVDASGSAESCTSAAQLHAIGFVIDGGGSVIATGDAKVYPTAAFACTINRIDIAADQSGSITVDVWKAAGAIPTSGNKISASAPLTLSSAQLAANGSRTGWTTSVSSGDVFGFSVATVSTVTRVVGQIWCQ